MPAQRRAYCRAKRRPAVRAESRNAEVSEKIKESLADAAQRVEDLNHGRRRQMLASLQEAARETGLLY